MAINYILEDKINEMISLSKELVEKTREEKGCISYILYQDGNDQSVFTFIEEWESKEALDAHMSAEHFTRLVPKISDISAKEPEFKTLLKVH